jgi:hypothetical protein
MTSSTTSPITNRRTRIALAIAGLAASVAVSVVGSGAVTSVAAGSNHTASHAILADGPVVSVTISVPPLPPIVINPDCACGVHGWD